MPTISCWQDVSFWHEAAVPAPGGYDSSRMNCGRDLLAANLSANDPSRPGTYSGNVVGSRLIR